MTAREDRTLVLLGAGASADANLPVTSELASEIVKRANAEQAEQLERGSALDWVRALNAVYAAMVGHRGTVGGNPLDAVNVETLISAVRLLQDRESHEVAPFVSSWSPSLSNFEASSISEAPGKAVMDAIGRAFEGHGAFAGREISQAVASAARAAMKPDLRTPFAAAETFVLRTLVEILGAIGDVGYLQPLVDLARQQRGGLDIITLNYDLTVESIAEQNGIAVQRGIESWQPGQPLDLLPRDNTINLMKLHGSLDWRRERGVGHKPQLLEPAKVIVDPESGSEKAAAGDQLPWIVVGDREKLATDGPTLMLNYAAREAFSKATHLVVVGYSFGDAHINAIVRDWIAGDDARTMSVLDYSWPWDHSPERQTDFRSALLYEYAQPRREWLSGEMTVPRMAPVEGSTKDRLADVLAVRPHILPDKLVDASAFIIEGGTRVDLVWRGDDLRGASVSLRSEPHVHGSGIVRVAATADDLQSALHEWERPWHVTKELLRSGEEMSVFFDAAVPFPLEVTISGTAISGGQSSSATIGVGERNDAETKSSAPNAVRDQ